MMLATAGTAVALAAGAQTPSDISYPVSELGNCGSKEACRVYCDQRDNVDVVRRCVGFAKAHNLRPAEEIARAERYVNAMTKGGPGGCKSEAACRRYCDDVFHVPVCLAFLEQNDLAGDEDLTELRQIARAFRAGASVPGGCGSRASCIAYCDMPNHAEECLTFAEAAGMLSPEELAEAKKFAPLVARGETPGRCTSKETCETYCSDAAHSEECLTFALAHDLLTPAEVELIRKTGGRGPGGCTSDQTCAAYCNDPAHQLDCLRFAAEHGLITPEEATQGGSVADFSACVDGAPPQIVVCLREHLGDELFTSMQHGVMPMRLAELQDVMARIRKARACLDQATQQQLQALTGPLSGAAACLREEFGGDLAEQLRSGTISCREIGSIQQKITKCVGTELGQDIETCFSKPCAESIACFNAAQKDSDRFPGATETSGDTRIRDRVESCITEIMHGCLAKPCAEIASCMQAVGGGGEQQTDAQPDPVIEARMSACAQEQQSAATGGTAPTYTPPTATETAPTYTAPPEYTAPTYTVPEYTAPPESTYTPPVYQVDCSTFASATRCSYVGPEDSDAYRYCKQCYPDR